jgi:hypothetical protein
MTRRTRPTHPMRRPVPETRDLETEEVETPELEADAGEAPKRESPTRDPSEHDAATRSLRPTLRRTAEPPRVGGKRGARMRHRNRQG